MQGIHLRATYLFPVGSGAIYAVIIGLWIVVLLPIWARRNDELNAGRQVDRFSRAMASLSTSRRPAELSIAVKRAPRAGTTVAKPLSAAARRRRVLAVLAATQLVALLALPLGIGAFALVPTALIAGFLVLARTQVRIERERREPQTRTQTQTAAPARPARQGGLGRALAAARTSAAGRARPVEQAPAAPVVEAPAVSGWMPVQTPVPSYINAPAATAVPRAIDADGGWTGAAMVQAARAMAEPPQPAVAAEAPQTRGFEAFDADITTEIPVIRITA